MTPLAAIDAFRPSALDDNWRELDAHVQALRDLDVTAVPTLLRVFERFPRHDGHGVLWSILHEIERVAGYEPILVEHVMRTPTEMGVTMLQRLIHAGTSHVGVHELGPLVVMLSSRTPIIDATVDPSLRQRAPLAPLLPLLARLAAFDPPVRWDTDWSPLRAIVDELLATRDPAIVTPLLETLDRFHTRDGFATFWPIVNGLEALPGFASALVGSLQHAPSRNGLTLLLRLLATGVRDVDGIEIAAFAAERLSAPAIQDAPDR